MPPLLAGLFDFVVEPPLVVVEDLPLLVLADVVDDVVVAERDVSSLREVSVASVVVVAEASVLEAVVVAFGGADDVLSVLPQAVMLIIVALIIKAAMAFIVFFIWFSSFLDLTYTFCPWTNLAEISCLKIKRIDVHIVHKFLYHMVYPEHIVCSEHFYRFF